MGYLITTTTPKLWQGVDYGGRDVTRRAVATLEEARIAASQRLVRSRAGGPRRVLAGAPGRRKHCPRRAARSARCPDGTTIEVTPHEYAGQVA